MKMNKENFVATMLAIYAILLTLCLALYAFIDIFNIDKSLASNLLVWSATIYAPIAVLCSLNYWKFQKKHEEKIEVLKSIKKKIVDFNLMIRKFRGTSKALYHLQNGEQKQLKLKINDFTIEFEDLLNKLYLEIVSSDELLSSHEKDTLNNLLCDFWSIIDAIDNALLIVETHALSIPREGLITHEPYEFEKNLYILEPKNWVFRKILTKDEHIFTFERFDEFTFQPLYDITEHIGNLLKNAYK